MQCIKLHVVADQLLLVLLRDEDDLEEGKMSLLRWHICAAAVAASLDLRRNHSNGFLLGVELEGGVCEQVSEDLNII